MWWKEFASLIWAKSLSYIFLSLDKTCSHCGRQGEPANLISTFIQTQERHFYSLVLTWFFSIIESSTTNVWNAKNAFLSPPSRWHCNAHQLLDVMILKQNYSILLQLSKTMELLTSAMIYCLTLFQGFNQTTLCYCYNRRRGKKAQPRKAKPFVFH